MARLFGTDGVRGIANVELTNQIAYRLGQAAVAFLGKTIVVGKDTRLSGDMLESAMVAGITSAGGTALLAGVVPTPAVALLVRKLNAAGGVQRHQAVRRAGLQAARCGGGRDRGLHRRWRPGGARA